MSKKKDGKLTPKQQKFGLLYLKHGKPSEAYREAYDAENMSDEAVAVEACRLLQNPSVALMVSSVRKKAEDKAVLNRAWVLERLMRNARIAMGEETVRLKLKPKGAEETIEAEISMRDAAAANKALELLGKTPELALFIERVEHGDAGEFERMSDDELDEAIAQMQDHVAPKRSKLNGHGKH